MAILFFSVYARGAALPRFWLFAGLALLAVALAPAPLQAQRIVTTAARTQAEALLQQAFDAYQADDFAQAERLIDQSDKLKPDQPDGWNLRGAVFLKQGAFDKATAAFTRAIALDPKLWAAQFNLAEVPFHQKNYKQARERFEALVDQTNRFKEGNRWELATYKVYLSCLLMGDDAAARKRLAKLPAKGGVTPAYLYAQAALSFSRKDTAGAARTLTTAQTAYPAAANALFASSLETVGWQTPAPVLPPVYAAAAPGSLPPAAGEEKPMPIDPKLEASVAEPLPASGGSGVYPKVPAVTTPPALPPAAGKSPAPTPATPPVPDGDHSGLLLP